MYGEDVLSGNWRRRKAIPEVDAERYMVVEDAGSGFCGAVVGFEYGAVVLEDRHGRRRNFPLEPAAFRLDGQVVTLRKPAAAPVPAARRTTASGSVAVADTPAQVARASRIWVEGVHDAALVERIWGEDLRIEGIVVEPLGGIDDLAEQVRQFQPGTGRRLGVLVDHLVPGSKETRIAGTVTSPHVLINGHPYVDIWQAVKPTALGIQAWPVVGREVQWKDGVAAALGVSDTREMWRRVLASVNSFADVEVPLLRSVEELIDFVTA
jgi:Protein of unknown function (DUF3097)